MDITFVVPALNHTGGIRVVSIYASYLANNGHKVTVISPNKRIFPIWTRLRSFLKGRGWDAGSHFSMDFFDNPKVNLKVLDIWRDITEHDVPDADVVIATFWNTAEWVNEYPLSKGRKFYFIQHYEIHSWLPIQRVKETLRKPFKKIVVAQWLENILVEEYMDPLVTIIPNGVDMKQFFSEKRSKQSRPTVGFFYSERSFKGCDLINDAINLVREKHPDLHVVAMGMGKPIKELPLPKNTAYFLNPRQDEIRKIYSQCDVWLFGSRSEGFGLTLLEAMACRTPVIGTKAGAASELLQEAEGQLIEIDDVEAMSEAIKKTINMSEDKWAYYSAKAYQTASNHTWKQSTKLFEKTLVECE